MDKRDSGRVKSMRKYCRDIASSIKRYGDSFEIFRRDRDYYNSVTMSIMQIGELTVGLTDEFKNATREQISWGAIRNMRNRFAHTYETVDKSEVWKTATEDIPVLLNFCNDVIESQK